MKNYLKRFIPKFIINQIKAFNKWKKRRVFFQHAPSITKEDLIISLKSISITKSDAVFVHSSLKGLGKIDGGVETVLDALEEVIGLDGNIIMPAFTMQSSMYETLSDPDYLFEVTDAEHISTGVISKIFTKARATQRSLHPTHSVSCKGPLAELLTTYDTDPLDNFGKSGPFGKALEIGVKIVGIGVSFRPVTFYHVLEDLYPEKFEGCYLPRLFEAKVKDYDDEVSIVKLKCHNPEYHKTRIEKVDAIHDYFRNRFIESGIVKITQVGLGEIWVMHSHDLIELLKSEYEKGKTIYQI